MTLCHHSTPSPESGVQRRRPAASTEDRMQALSHLSPDQLRGIFQMLSPTMHDVQRDNEARVSPNRFEEVLARYALEGLETIELANASDDAVSDSPPEA